jgi:hypothetical protein
LPFYFNKISSAKLKSKKANNPHTPNIIHLAYNYILCSKLGVMCRRLFVNFLKQKGEGEECVAVKKCKKNYFVSFQVQLMASQKPLSPA